jgi:signal transduction histidine kinase
MIELLRELDLFQDVDEQTLAEFAARGQERRLEVGEALFVEGTVIERFNVVVEGTIEWSRCINGVDLVLSERSGPTYAGAANLLTGDPAVATGRAATPVRLITWDADSFQTFLRAAPGAMQTSVRLIAPIAQAAESAVQQQEKLAALGTLSAGLAHELNNPAAAARRTASELAEALDVLQSTIHHFVSSGVERDQAARLVELQQAALAGSGSTTPGDAVAAADREDELAASIDAIGQEGWRLAEPLARAGVDQRWLDDLSQAAGSATGAALEWVAASLTARTLVAELHESTARISELVAAVKEYTHMDRAAVEDVDLHEGIESTLTMLGHRLKHGRITIERHYDRTLPKVTVHGSELNQVWTNLLANALDAVNGEGTIAITTRHTGSGVAVDIADDGAGIPEEVQTRIFEPFFTTKAVGEGTGLGLDIAHRIVTGQRGDITVRSQPGSTTFTVSLPVAARTPESRATS